MSKNNGFEKEPARHGLCAKGIPNQRSFGQPAYPCDKVVLHPPNKPPVEPSVVTRRVRYYAHHKPSGKSFCRETEVMNDQQLLDAMESWNRQKDWEYTLSEPLSLKRQGAFGLAAFNDGKLIYMNKRDIQALVRNGRLARPSVEIRLPDVDRQELSRQCPVAFD